MLDVVIVLHILSITAIISTVSLFFCGIPICIEIWRRKGTDEISGVPFIMGLIGGCFWLRYGFLKFDATMITVNVIGASLFTFYSIFYLIMSRPRTSFGIQLLVVLCSIFGMVLLVYLYESQAIDPLGMACMTFNIISFGAPLAGLKVVLRKRCCDTLPLPMCCANLLVSTQWCIYGILIHDVYVITPNSCGMFLAVLQLSLFIIFPRKEGGTAPVTKLAGFLYGEEEKDLEKGVKPTTCAPKQSVRDLMRKISLKAESQVPLLPESSECLLAPTVLSNGRLIAAGPQHLSSALIINAPNFKVQSEKDCDRYTRSMSFDTMSTVTTNMDRECSTQSACSSQKDVSSLARTFSAPALNID